MFLMHLDIDSVDALLNIIPGEELLTLGEGLCSKTDQCVCISNKAKQPQDQVNYLTVSQSVISYSWHLSLFQSVE